MDSVPEHGHLAFPLGVWREAEDHDGARVTDTVACVDARGRKQWRNIQKIDQVPISSGTCS